MAISFKVLGISRHTPELRYYALSFSDADPGEVSDIAIDIGEQGTVIGYKWESDSGTVLPRLLVEGADASEGDYALASLAKCPGPAAQSGGRAVKQPYRCPGGKAVIDLGGTTDGRAGTIEIIISPRIAGE